MGGEIGVGEREMVVAEEAAIGREGRGMGRGEDEMALSIDQGALALGMAAPEDEHEMVAAVGQAAHHGVGKLLPAVAGM